MLKHGYAESAERHRKLARLLPGWRAAFRPCSGLLFDRSDRYGLPARPAFLSRRAHRNGQSARSCHRAELRSSGRSGTYCPMHRYRPGSRRTGCWTIYSEGKTFVYGVVLWIPRRIPGASSFRRRTPAGLGARCWRAARCQTAKIFHLNEIELQVFAANESIQQFCKSCSATTSWQRANKGSTSRSGSPKAVEQQNPKLTTQGKAQASSGWVEHTSLHSRTGFSRRGCYLRHLTKRTLYPHVEALPGRCLD